jgi:hypothetical protein
MMLPVVATTVVLLFAVEPELTLQQVVKANSGAINAIRSIHVTIDVANNLPATENEPPPPEILPIYTIVWYKDHGRERVLMNWHRRGRVPRNSDRYNGPDGYRGLVNYDPKFEPPLSESIARPAYGELDKRQTGHQFASAARSSSYIDVFAGGGPTLEEYVAKNPDCKLAATPATSKFSCYEITTLQKMESGPGKAPDVRDVRVFVDPAVGFWIRRIESGPLQKSTDPGDKGEGIGEVQEFKDCGNGVFWPLKSRFTRRLPGRTDGIEISTRHTLHSINQPLPEKVFDIRFPDWLRVFDNQSGKVYVWGPDGKPRMTFGSQGEYQEWYRPRAKDPFVENMTRPRPWRVGWFAGVNIGVVALLILLVLWRRRRSRPAANPTS